MCKLFDIISQKCVQTLFISPHIFFAPFQCTILSKNGSDATIHQRNANPPTILVKNLLRDETTLETYI